MRSLLPTLKERKRYILFNLISDLDVERDEVSRCVNQACLQFLGELGMAKAGIQFIPESWNGKTGIIRVGHKYVNETKSALALVKDINGKRVAFNCVQVSGSLNKVKS